MTLIKTRWIPLLATLALITLVMLPGLTGNFIFDDFTMIVDNQAVHIGAGSSQTWLDLLHWAQSNIQRPLSMLSYGLNYACGASTWDFKATNLAIHLLNTLLVVALLQRLLHYAWQAQEIGKPQILAWASAIALLWAIHPLQVSAVMYVVQRMELLGMSFVLLALLAYLHGRQRQLVGARAWPWFALSLVLIAAGYTAKETAILVSGYALLIELTLLNFRTQSTVFTRYWQAAYALGVLVAVVVLLAYVLPHFAPGGQFPGRPFDAAQREFTQLRALSMYIGWIVLPQLGQMHFYYDNYVISDGLFSPLSTLFSGLFLLALVVLAIVLRRRRPLFALGIGWFFVAHALTSAPLPLELVFEHRNYPALLGIVLAVTDLAWAATRRGHPRMPAILLTIAVVSLGFLCVLRAATWGNPLQLELTLVHDNPGSPRASFDLARRYMTMAQGQMSSPFFKRAMDELSRGAALPGSSPLPEQALILTAAMYDFPAEQAWWDALEHKLVDRPFGPQEYLALKGLVQGLINDGDKIDATQLAGVYQAITLKYPTNASLHVQYADVASVALKNQAIAIAQLHLALAANTKRDYARELIAYLLEHQRIAEAQAVLADAQQRWPELVHDTDWAKLRQASQAKTGADLGGQVGAQ